MFFVLKKNDIILFVLIVCISYFTVSLWLNRHNSADVPVFSVPTTNKVIVIDAGHGGVDNGASANGVMEKEVNLAVALKLQDLIESSGGVAILTRESDRSTQDPDRPKNLTQKKSDLMERKQHLDEDMADIFVSIHMNKFEQSKYRGAQVFYSSAVDESKILAENIQKSIMEATKDTSGREVKQAGSNIFVLKDMNKPSVLVECGFLSNPEDARLLQTEEYQRKVAWGIYMGIVKYFSGSGQ